MLKLFAQLQNRVQTEEDAGITTVETVVGLISAVAIGTVVWALISGKLQDAVDGLTL